MDQTGRDRLSLRTDHAILLAEDAGGGLTRVNMGPPVLDWRAIPLARAVDIDHLPIDGDPAATGEYAVPMIQSLLDRDMPIFGICLGHQMLALALGARDFISKPLDAIETLLRVWNLLETRALYRQLRRLQPDQQPLRARPMALSKRT